MMIVIKTIFRIAAAFTFFLISCQGSSLAQDQTFKDIPMGKNGFLKFVPGPKLPETLGRFDTLVLVPSAGVGSGPASSDNNGKVVFETEGRTLRNMESGDLDGDGSPEILLTLDPGSGSGGYVDFTLLTASGPFVQTLWENTAKGGQGALREQKENRRQLVINYLWVPDPKAAPASKTAVFQLKEGKVALVEGEDPSQEADE